jgi:hypothetical protein
LISEDLTGRCVIRLGARNSWLAGLLAEKAREVRWIGECEVVRDLVDRRPGKYKLALRLGQNPLADEMSGGNAGRPLDVIVEPVRGHGQLVGVEAEQSFLAKMLLHEGAQRFDGRRAGVSVTLPERARLAASRTTSITPAR